MEKQIRKIERVYSMDIATKKKEMGYRMAVVLYFFI